LDLNLDVILALVLDWLPVAQCTRSFQACVNLAEAFWVHDFGPWCVPPLSAFHPEYRHRVIYRGQELGAELGD
jgi:hypothetical protein